MSYDHSMNASIKLLPPVGVEAALLMLQPLADYFDWTQNEIVSNELTGDHTVEFIIAADQVTQINLFTCGEVPYDFPKIVDAFASSLTDYAEPGYIDLRDHETGDLDNAIATIWYGKELPVAQAKRLHAWYLSCNLMESADVPDAVMGMMKALGCALTAGTDNPVKKDWESPANLFWNELLMAMESLSAIADQYGAKTLSDLMYLQNAILSGRFIEHDGLESSLVEVVALLPSKEQWMSFIELVEPAS